VLALFREGCSPAAFLDEPLLVLMSPQNLQLNEIFEHVYKVHATYSNGRRSYLVGTNLIKPFVPTNIKF